MLKELKPFIFLIYFITMREAWQRKISEQNVSVSNAALPADILTIIMSVSTAGVPGKYLGQE